MNLDIVRNQGWKRFLFSFQGRASRTEFWLYVLISAVAGLVTRGANLILFELGLPLVMNLLGLVVTIVSMWSWWAVNTRRIHDYDRSLWWLGVPMLAMVLLNLPFMSQLAAYMTENPGILEGVAAASTPIPTSLETSAYLAIFGGGFALIAVLVVLVLNGFKKGSPGPNRFGPAPLA